jgi:pSer/pThr/pTyr-binding forkhead associated (FHA) protein
MTPDLFLLQQSHVKPVRRFLLSDGRFVVGRSADCDIVVDHATVSRRHCEIWVSSGSINVYDLGSRNGTYIDDRPVIQCPVIRQGQHLRCGNVSFVLSLDRAKEAEPDSEVQTTDCVESEKARSATVQISAAQNRVLEQLLKGQSDKEIAKRLHISPKTVHLHVQAIFRAHGVHSRPELLATFLPTLRTQPARPTMEDKT